MKQLTFNKLLTTLDRLTPPIHPFRSLLGYGTVPTPSVFKNKNEIVNGNKEFTKKNWEANTVETDYERAKEIEKKKWTFRIFLIELIEFRSYTNIYARVLF